MDLTLTTREAIKAASDIATTARANDAIDRANASASEAVEADLNRRFRPLTTTLYRDWPHPDQPSTTWKLWLNADELISITSLTVAGEAFTENTDYWLRPETGPPFNRIELNLGGDNPSFNSAASTAQRSIVAVGLVGHSNTERTLSTVAEALDASETAVDVTGAVAAKVGVGDIIRVDNERMWISERDWLDSGQNIGGALTAAVNDQDLAVSDGTEFATGERLLINSETVEITAITGNTLTIKRAVDGSTLAAHSSGADIYASRTLTVERGVLGTTAATHISSATVHRHVVPRLVEQLTILEALVELGLGRAGGATQAGEGTSSFDSGGGGIATTWERCRRSYQRRARFRTVGR